MGYEFKVGDRVMGTKDALSHRVGTLGRVTRLQGKGIAFVLWDGEDEDHFAPKNEIVKIGEEPMHNVTQEPKLWCDMTRAEKGELLLAKYEKKAIECYEMGSWNVVIGTNNIFYHGTAYRVKPEPKRETVTSKLCITSGGTSYNMRPDYCRGEYGDDNFYFTLTFDLIDGKLDLSSLKLEDT